MSSTFTDDACPTGDPKDSPGKNKGLLLVKTGPTPNFAAAGAVLNGVKGIMLTELGYDIRTGSHCGAGAPRFNVRTDVAFYFVGCNSPPATILVPFSNSWKRLRWMTPCVLGFNTSTNAFECVTGAVQSITIIFDEGTDTPSAGPPGPESGSGLAFLDNIDVNGTLVGRGPGN